ncbi:hypothetical protein FEDK69T_04380 [Flavobacterium enshiense DK69]|uniref:Uncharacterized protein n=1 Tax=Flavobacterium enshiense DK69 TaxID=1107311 RepID=V6SEI7_9FLAO|nr:hypothetical protein [Flavobacterium enshiense]ESU24884.1 hypothetical protein FEDK69T_04380 [Flavobacterium enshiense DK69]KGO96670.1 hypothetical protein Q767_02875 [Flavobacterium enshiense DK69]
MKKITLLCVLLFPLLSFSQDGKAVDINIKLFESLENMRKFYPDIQKSYKVKELVDEKTKQGYAEFLPAQSNDEYTYYSFTFKEGKFYLSYSIGNALSLDAVIEVFANHFIRTDKIISKENKTLVYYDGSKKVYEETYKIPQ